MVVYELTKVEVVQQLTNPPAKTNKKLKIKLKSLSKQKSKSEEINDLPELNSDDAEETPSPECNIQLNITSVLQPKMCEPISKDNPTEKIKYKNHFISFVILYHFDYGLTVRQKGAKCVLGNNILLYKNNFIPTQSFKYTPEFKYKKYIREFMLSKLHYKNKDIIGIKSIHVHKNYHNYLVFVKPNSTRHKQYPNVISDITSEYSWKQTFDWYDPHKTKENIYEEPQKAHSPKEAYTHLLETNTNKRVLSDTSGNNQITNHDLYKAIMSVV